MASVCVFYMLDTTCSFAANIKLLGRLQDLMLLAIVQWLAEINSKFFSVVRKHREEIENARYTFQWSIWHYLWKRSYVSRMGDVGRFQVCHKTFCVLRQCLFKITFGCNLWTKKCCIGRHLADDTHFAKTRLYPLGITAHHRLASLWLSSWKSPVSRGIQGLI